MRKRGCPPGDGRNLTQAQEERTRKDIVDHTPDQLKRRFALWIVQAGRALMTCPQFFWTRNWGKQTCLGKERELLNESEAGGVAPGALRRA